MPYKRKLDFDEMPSKRTKVTAVRAVGKQESELAELRAKQKKTDARLSRLLSSREKKVFDVVEGPDNLAYDTNNTYTLLFPGQGSANDNRIGDQVSPSYMHVQGYIYSDTTFTGLVRMLLIRSKKNFVPSVITSTGTSAVFQNAGSFQTVNSQFYDENREDFTVLHDEVIVVNAPGVDRNVVPFKINKRLSGKTIYETSSATPQQGAYYLCFTSTLNGVAAPQLNFTSRVWYYDD